MMKILIEFCRDVRRASSSSVSIAETIEAMKALSHIEITNMQEFKTALRSIIIKNSDDFELFDMLFSIYFLNQKDKEVDEIEEEQKIKELQEQLKDNEDEFLKEFEELDNLSQEIVEHHSDSDEEKAHAEDSDSDSNHKHNDIQSQRFDSQSDSEQSSQEFQELFENFDSESQNSQPQDSNQELQESTQSESQNSEQQQQSQSQNSEQQQQGQSQNSESAQKSQSQSLSNINLTQTPKGEMKKLAEQVNIDDVQFSQSSQNILLHEAIESEANSQLHEKLHSSGYFQLVRKEELKANSIENQDEYKKYCKEANEKLNEFKDSLKKRIKEKLKREAIEKFSEQYLQEIQRVDEKDFNEFNEDDVEKARKIVKKLARKIKTKASRRYREAKKGRIDMRKTIRDNIRHSALIDLKFKKKKKQKLKRLIVCCDISGSCEFISELFLTVTEAMRKEFRDTIVYFFIQDVVQVHDEDFRDAVQKAYSACEDQGYSHIDDAMYSLSQKEFKKDDVLVILSDFRNNGRDDAGVDDILTIKEKIHKIILLNPESEEEWGGDSEADVYAQNFEMQTVSNLRTLERAISNLSNTK